MPYPFFEHSQDVFTQNPAGPVWLLQIQHGRPSAGVAARPQDGSTVTAVSAQPPVLPSAAAAAGGRARLTLSGTEHQSAGSTGQLRSQV